MISNAFRRTLNGLVLIAAVVIPLVYLPAPLAPRSVASAPRFKAGAFDKTTYTGCLEAGPSAGVFTLTHVKTEMGMHKDAMQHDKMQHEAMQHEAMHSTAFRLVGKGNDLARQIGHTVTVTGTVTPADAMLQPDAMATSDATGKALPSLSVTSLETIAAKCGK